MGLNWKPHTQPPVFDQPTSILVALSAGEDAPAIILGFYTAHKGEVCCEVDGQQFADPYFWVTEEEALEGLPCAA